MSELYERIRTEVDGIQLVDTHEHLMSEGARLERKLDFFYWFCHYASSDVISAGFPEGKREWLLDPDVPLDERWASFAPYWEHARTTGYGRALLLAARDLLEVEDINAATYSVLSDKLARSNRPGWYEYVLKERAGIDVSVLQSLEEYDPIALDQVDRRFFAPVVCMSDFIMPCDQVALDALSGQAGLPIHCLQELLAVVDRRLGQAVEAQVVGVKVSLAYQRTLQFDRALRNDAEGAFNLLFQTFVRRGVQQPPASVAELKPLHDYLMHHVVRRSMDLGLPMQVHTGLQEGNGNILANSNPLHLVNLFLEYPEQKFDLFHAGYPWQSEMATLGKNFANVFVDMCWLHVISPWVARQTLHEWIETVPSNKIFGFGGDYIFVEGAYAHAQMARADVAQVLAEKVETRYLTEDEAIGVARKILRENAKRFFGL